MFNILKSNRSSGYQRDTDFKKSYAQCGEDIIIDFIFNEMKIAKPTYLDIGAHHPTFLNNTYFFYQKGSRGVSVEPDPDLIPPFRKIRPEDKVLNVGIGTDDKIKNADFYILSAKTLNTFSKEEAENCVSYGRQKIERVIQVPLLPVNSLLKEYYIGRPLDFVSIDVEGLDYQIIQSFDFNLIRPKVICIETITYSENKSERKLHDLINLTISKGYLLYADTYINSIFVDSDAWKER